MPSMKYGVNRVDLVGMYLFGIPYILLFVKDLLIHNVYNKRGEFAQYKK